MKRLRELAKHTSPEKGRAKHIIFCVAILGFGLTIGAMLGEFLLRFAGRRPWSYNTIDSNVPTMYEPDPILGWKNKEGKYLFPAYHPNAKEIETTFWTGGKRATAVSEIDRGNDAILLGCSYTQGWAISDHETFAWKLQKKHPYIDILNYGTSGYGTYQNLLMLEKIAKDPLKPSLAVYGFIDHHESRNVASGKWLEILSASSRRVEPYTPYCTLDNKNELIRYPPIRYPIWPFREIFASVNDMQKLYMRIKTMKRDSQKKEVTENLLIEMDNLSKINFIKFVVVLLEMDRENEIRYIKFFRENNISFVNCVIYPLTDELRVPGEGHPNEKAHTYWANCIAEAIDHALNP